MTFGLNEANSDGDQGEQKGGKSTTAFQREICQDSGAIAKKSGLIRHDISCNMHREGVSMHKFLIRIQQIVV